MACADNVHFVVFFGDEIVVKGLAMLARINKGFGQGIALLQLL